MPSSNHTQISKIMDIVVLLNPNSVLDIGVGFGKYGFLCREYLELWDGRQDCKKFLRKIDGVEAFSGYLNPVHDFIYDKIYLGNILDLIENENIEINYDLVLLIDVIEHFEKEEGFYLIKKILEKNKGIIISTPKDIGEQEDMFGNIYEKHKSSWEVKDFLKMGNAFFIQDLLNHIVYIGSKEEIKKIKSVKNFNFKIREHFFKIPMLPYLYKKIKKIFIHK